MIFQFKDLSRKLMHLGAIYMACKANKTTMRIRESSCKGVVAEDLLEYHSAKALDADLDRLYEVMDAYSRHVDQMEEQQKIGFTADAAAPQDIPEEEQE